MEQVFVHHTETATTDFYSQWFDWFVRDYLTLKNGSIPKIGFVYDEFKL